VEISEMLSQAMSVLKMRPILFKYTLDEYCNSRRNAVVKFFIDSLTRGSGTTKPIELNSHDPLRYIGDMLACIHLTTASEYEYLRSLFRKMSKEFGKFFFQLRLQR
jgi:conserved oligomeric Golgi complex subunit 6